MAKKKDAAAEIGAVKENESNSVLEMAFTKEQLLSSERFRGKRDLLNALLEEDKTYTASQAEEMIEKYMKGKVK